MPKTAQKFSMEKSTGRVYTPNFIVRNVLNLSGYNTPAILKKHCIDNSCGDGAFLTEVVARYCTFAREQNVVPHDLAHDLETYIHGIELDPIECEKCKQNLNAVVATFGLPELYWDVLCANALTVKIFDRKMDFVVGNPPYIRVHHFGDDSQTIKTFSFAQNGMTDLYIVFYEIGLRMLCENGTLGYITPSSFFNSLAGSFMRRYFVEKQCLRTIVDLKHFKAFDAGTYTAIVVLQNAPKNTPVSYYEFDSDALSPVSVSKLHPEDFYLHDNFYFSTPEILRALKKVFHNNGVADLTVKNGFATLCDDVFIRDFEFTSPHIIPVLKASKGASSKLIYPYTPTGALIPESTLQKDKPLYHYLSAQKDRLLQRSSEKKSPHEWYAFGRSQAIGDTFKEKLSLNTLVRNLNDLKIHRIPPGTGVYSGLYITSDTIPLDFIRDILITDDFMAYVALLGKYKSGGYYTYSSKDVTHYLNALLA